MGQWTEAGDKETATKQFPDPRPTDGILMEEPAQWVPGMSCHEATLFLAYLQTPQGAEYAKLAEDVGM